MLRLKLKTFASLLAVTLTIPFSFIKAQDTSNTIGHVSIASPNAASLGKYGDIPVSYNTGIPQISIPIYTIESGSLKLPISLSYHASGLKVQEPASWVGAGWSLNAGGMITRTVVGSPDDRGNSSVSFSNVTNGHYSDYGFSSYLSTSNTPTGTPDDIDFARGFKDGEPDLYFFNFGGYSGKFYFNDDRQPIIVPEQDFKIVPSLTVGPGFTGFVVTTPDGVRYFFGQTGNNGAVTPVETSVPSTIQYGLSTNGATSSWFLNKIMSADGVDSITFNYQAESYSYYALSLSPVMNANYIATQSDKMGITLIKNFVQGVRLSGINFANGSVSFTKAASVRTDLTGGSSVDNTFNDATNNSAYALGSITVTNSNGFCKKDSLYYSYFFNSSGLNSNFFNASYTSFNIHSDEYRLRLDSMQELSCDAVIKLPPYKFTYFTETVPRRLSFGVDHWGYPNGATNPGLVPTFSQTVSGTTTTTTGANRDAAWPAMRGGALQKITYPTGGTTTFDFEPRDTYTFNSSVFENVTLKTQIVHEFGKSNLADTAVFTLTGSGACTIYVQNNSTNWSPTITIYNSSNAVVYGPTLVAFSGSPDDPLNTSIILPAGVYTSILGYPSNATPTPDGCNSAIGQFQNVNVQTTQYVSGLRIKTITNNDGITPTNNVTSYTYPAGSPGSNGGVLYSIPVYVQVIRNDLLALVWPLSCSPNGCQSCDLLNAHNYFISPGSIQPMSTFQGENVGYPEVDVTQTGNGHSVYRYYGSNIWTTTLSDVCVRYLAQSSLCSTSIPNFPAPPVPFEFMRGELQYEGYFNEAGSVLKEVYHYPIFTADPLTTPGHISINLPSLYSYTEYQLQSASRVQDKDVTISYDPSNGGSVTTTNTTYYGSAYHHQPSRKVVTTSIGDSLITNIKYAFDFRQTSCDAIPDSLPYYQSKVHGDTTWLNSHLSSCTPQTNDASNCRVGIFAQFRDSMALHRYNLITYRRRSFTDPGNLLATCYAGKEATADTISKPIMRLQDEYYNAPIEVSNFRDANLLHASFTKFDSSTNPVGFAYPGRALLINLQAPSTTFTASAVSGNTITKDSRYQDESTFKFSRGNPLQVAPRDGILISYVWDYLNKQPIAKTSNAANVDIAYTSFEADGKGGWTFSGTPATDAQAITGGKDYVLTNDSITINLNFSKTYIISYWSKGAGGSASVNGATATALITKNGWTYYEHKITASSAKIKGSGVTIDELRCYPVDAQMTTYTYNPLLGMTSTCDADNRITYFVYDSLGRLRWVKDADGNIIKTIQYHYTGQTTAQ